MNGADSDSPSAAAPAAAPAAASPECFAECRICQEEDRASRLEAPCACSGTVKYAHRECVQRWCDEKGHIICEICCQPYRNGYWVSAEPTFLIPRFVDQGNQIDVLGGGNLMLDNSDYEEGGDDDDNEQIEELSSVTAALCRAVAFALLFLVFELYTIVMTTSCTGDDFTICSLIFPLRVAGFFLPCYCVAKAVRLFNRIEVYEDTQEDDRSLDVILEQEEAREVRLFVC